MSGGWMNDWEDKWIVDEWTDYGMEIVREEVIKPGHYSGASTSK